MKILIVGLLSLIVLTACAQNPSQFHREIPIQTPDLAVDIELANIELAAGHKGLKDFCDDNKLVLVVFVDKKGKPKIRKCPGIRIEEDLPDGVDAPYGPPGALGGTQKWKSNTDPDPCIQWSSGGWSRFYCWQ
jgi:hypothetical protein